MSALAGVGIQAGDGQARLGNGEIAAQGGVGGAGGADNGFGGEQVERFA